MAGFRRGGANSGFGFVVSVVKIAFLLLGVVSVATAAWTSVPTVVGGLASVLPRCWALFRVWLMPPYLFITVHLIILVIWKLSDNKQQHHWDQMPAAEGGKQPSEQDNNGVKIKTLEESPAVSLSRKPSLKIWQDKPASGVKVKTSGAYLASHLSRNASPEFRREISPPLPEAAVQKPVETITGTVSIHQPTASLALNIKKNVAEPAAENRVAVVEQDEDAVEAEEEDALSDLENQSLEATWKAIVERSSRNLTEVGPPPPSPARGVRMSLPSVDSYDELNRKFEDFIKKKYEQLRLERHESTQRQR